MLRYNIKRWALLGLLITMTLMLSACEVSDSISEVLAETVKNSELRVKAEEEYYSTLTRRESKVIDFWTDTYVVSTRVETNKFLIKDGAEYKIMTHNNKTEGELVIKDSATGYSYVEYYVIPETVRYKSTIKSEDGTFVEVNIFEAEMLLPIYYIHSDTGK